MSDEEWPRSGVEMWKNGGRSSLSPQLFLLQRQPQREAAAATFTRMIDDFTAVLARESLRECEAEPRSLNAARERIVRAIEGLENFSFFAGRNTGTAIEHAHANVIAIDIAVQFHFLVRARVLLGVGKQVHKNLRERVFIADDRIRRHRGF